MQYGVSDASRFLTLDQSEIPAELESALERAFLALPRKERSRILARLRERMAWSPGAFEDSRLSYAINDPDSLLRALPNFLDGLVQAGQRIRGHEEVRVALVSDRDVDRLAISIDPRPGRAQSASSLRTHDRWMFLSIAIDHTENPPPDTVAAALAIVEKAYCRATRKLGVTDLIFGSVDTN